MQFTMEEIRKLMKTEYDTLTEDTLPEIADSVTPVYYNEIMRDWAEMPSHYNDSWKEYGYDANKNEGGILQLMALDLYFYNVDRVTEVWRELEESEGGSDA